MVTLLPMQEFLSTFGQAMRVRINLSPYDGHPFDCACGAVHSIESCKELLCQGYRRVIAVCPDNSNYLTNIKVQTFLIFKFLGFKSLNGTLISTEEDEELLRYVLAQLR